MEKTGWKLLLTIICLITAGGLMVGFRNVAASEMDEMSAVTEPENRAEDEGPSIEWRMEEVDSYEGISYYRQDNCGLSVIISDAASEPDQAEVKIGESEFSLDDFKTEDGHTFVLELTAEEMSDLMPNDGEVTAYAYVKDANDFVDEDMLTFVLDRTPPEYTLSLEAPSGEETTDGEIAFYGSSHDRLRAVYTIKEDYFASTLIGADDARADVTANPIRTDVKAKQITGGSGYTGEQTYVVETDEGTEGIYRFGISGTDLAGNPLIMSGPEAQKDGYQRSIYEEGYGYWTVPKVLDLTRPTVSFTVSDSKGDVFYEAEATDQAITVLKYEPFQQCDRARITIRAKDEMTCRIDYQIQSSLSGTISGNSGARQRFLAEPEVTETVTGEQRFRIDKIEVRDRSGNVLHIGRSNTLFLDQKSPTAVIDAPEPVVIAADEITHRNADGRGLYNDDITLRVSVTDDEGCGLRNVFCKVLVNGKEQDTEMTYAEALSDCLNDAPEFLLPEEIVYGDDIALDDLQTSYTGTITIPKGDVYETNDIEVLVYATDAAGNGTEEEPARLPLGMDSKGPEVKVNFDNNTAQNEQYFKEPRIATLQVYDRNVDADMITVDTQSDEISGTLYESGNDIAGNDDCYVRTVRYDKDGTYTLAITGTDALGNTFEKEVMFAGTSPRQFVIDQTAPSVSVENVEAGNAYNGTIAPVVRFSDKNFSKDLAELSLTGSRTGDRRDLLSEITEDVTGGSCAMQDIPVKKENDDIYTLKAKQKDLAGNESQTEIEFSVNRFGSTYDYNNDRSTQELMTDYYTGQEKKIYLREINLNRLTDQKVTLYHDGSNRILQRGIDYQVRQDGYGDSMQYIYAFSGHNFKKEGIYEVIVQSVDAAGNINSNHVMRQDDGIESVRIRFAVDKTAPQIFLNGSDATKEPVFSEGEEIQVLPGDNMQLEKVEMSLGKPGETEGSVLGSYKGTDLLQKLLQANGVLSFTFDAQNKEQHLMVRAVDAAGNESVGAASCKAPDEMQKAGLFQPFVQTGEDEENGEASRDNRYGIPVAAAGAMLLILLGRKKWKRA